MIIIISFFLILSVIGCIIPSIPGPPIAFFSLLIYHFYFSPFEIYFLILLIVIVLLVTFLDFYLQIYTIKKFGGSKYAVRGSLIGVLLGLIFFPPFGIFLGAFFGAFIGSQFQNNKNSLKIAIGSLWGFTLGTILKLSTCAYIIYVILL